MLVLIYKTRLLLPESTENLSSASTHSSYNPHSLLRGFLAKSLTLLNFHSLGFWQAALPTWTLLCIQGFWLVQIQVSASACVVAHLLNNLPPSSINTVPNEVSNPSQPRFLPSSVAQLISTTDGPPSDPSITALLTKSQLHPDHHNHHHRPPEVT
jgi:hypothetical protein